MQTFQHSELDPEVRATWDENITACFLCALNRHGPQSRTYLLPSASYMAYFHFTYVLYLLLCALLIEYIDITYLAFQKWKHPGEWWYPTLDEILPLWRSMSHWQIRTATTFQYLHKSSYQCVTVNHQNHL